MIPAFNLRTFRLFIMGAVLLWTGQSVRADEIKVVGVGNAPKSMDCYRVGSVYYLDARRVGSLYRGQMYWRPRSGTVSISLHGRQVQFSVNSNKATVGDR